jgi:hypothetical protein
LPEWLPTAFPFAERDREFESVFLHRRVRCEPVLAIADSIEVIYFATLLDPVEKIMIDPEDHSGFIWLSRDEIDAAKPITDAELRNVRKAFELLHGGQLDFTA